MSPATTSTGLVNALACNKSAASPCTYSFRRPTSTSWSANPCATSATASEVPTCPMPTIEIFIAGLYETATTGQKMWVANDLAARIVAFDPIALQN